MIISDRQRTVHIAAEGVAILAVVPFSAYLVTRKQLPTWARVASGILGVGTLFIDGWLLSRFLKAES